MYIFSCNLSKRFFDNEFHIKIGGDHGGGSFKMSYQVCNIEKPNSKENTIVFSVFEAKDCHPNLRIGLGRFKDQIDQLQASTWKYVFNSVIIIVVFL